MDKIKDYLRLLRVRQYIKNILIFLPLVLSFNIKNMSLVAKSIYGWIIFSCVASCIYIFNDMKDKGYDAEHPRKCKRPLAAGKISSKKAKNVLLGLSILVFILICIQRNIYAAVLLLLYVITNIVYTLYAKNISILDVLMLAAGYMIRIIYGGTICNIKISAWVTITAFSAALWLGFGKRCNEMKEVITNEKVYGHGCLEQDRKNSYTMDFLKNNVNNCMTLTVIFYSLACMDSNTTVAQNGVNLIGTIPLVIIICLEYMLLIDRGEEGDPVEVVLNNKFLLVLILLYGVVLLFMAL